MTKNNKSRECLIKHTLILTYLGFLSIDTSFGNGRLIPRCISEFIYRSFTAEIRLNNTLFFFGEINYQILLIRREKNKRSTFVYSSMTLFQIYEDRALNIFWKRDKVSKRKNGIIRKFQTFDPLNQNIARLKLLIK